MVDLGAEVAAKIRSQARLIIQKLRAKQLSGVRVGPEGDGDGEREERERENLEIQIEKRERHACLYVVSEVG